MDKLFSFSFTLLIAYVVPGTVSGYAIGLHFWPIGQLYAFASSEAVLGVIFVGLAAGILTNAFAWVVIRPLIERTSKQRPHVVYAALLDETRGLAAAVTENYFRYYQSYVNLLAATAILGGSLLALGDPPRAGALVVFLVAFVVLFLAARDALQRTYLELAAILEEDARRRTQMTNGFPNHEAFQRELRNRLTENRIAFEGEYGDEIKGLLGLSLEALDHLTPDTTDLETYDQLITIVKQASANNIAQAELKNQIMKLGSVAVTIAKRVPKLARLFA